MQLWYRLVNFTFINKELCLQNNQIKSAIWFKMDVVIKQYNIFIKCNWCRIWTASINYNQPKWLHVCTWPKYMVNWVSILSTKRTSNVIFNSHVSNANFLSNHLIAKTWLHSFSISFLCGPQINCFCICWVLSQH